MYEKNLAYKHIPFRQYVGVVRWSNKICDRSNVARGPSHPIDTKAPPPAAFSVP